MKSFKLWMNSGIAVTMALAFFITEGQCSARREKQKDSITTYTPIHGSVEQISESLFRRNCLAAGRTRCQPKPHLLVLPQPKDISTIIDDKIHFRRISTRQADESNGSREEGSGDNDGFAPSREELLYAQNHCDADSYAYVVRVSPDENLWDLIEQHSGTYRSDRSWMTLPSSYSVWEWDGVPEHAIGVLYLLPAGARFDTRGVTQYFYYSDKKTYKHIAPRIGLCGLPGESRPALVNSGRGISRGGYEYGFGFAPEGGIYVGALYFAQAQAHFYHLDIDANQVDHRTSAIELHYGAKLFIRDVSMTRARSANDMENRSGLILSLDSIVGIDEGSLSQTTSNGTLIYSDDSTIDINNVSITARENSDPIVSWKSTLSIRNNNFTGHHDNADSPIALLTLDSQEADEIREYCDINDVEHCMEPDAQDSFFLAPDGSWAECDGYVDYCLNNQVTMSGNIFRGSWQNILWVLADIYSPESINNQFQHAGLVQCAEDGSASLKGNVYFQDAGACLPEIAPTTDNPSASPPPYYQKINNQWAVNATLQFQLPSDPPPAASKKDSGASAVEYSLPAIINMVAAVLAGIR